MPSYLFGNVGGARVHTDEALFIAAAATPEHVHAGRLEERVGAPAQLAGHLHARLSGAALSALPFLVYNCRKEAHWGRHAPGLRSTRSGSQVQGRSSHEMGRLGSAL